MPVMPAAITARRGNTPIEARADVETGQRHQTEGPASLDDAETVTDIGIASMNILI